MYADRPAFDIHLGAGQPQLVRHGLDMLGFRARDFHIPSGEGRGGHERTGFDAVGDDAHFGRMQAVDAMNGYFGSSGTFDAGPHFDQGIGQGRDFRFPGGIAQDRGALGQHGRHHQVFGAGHRYDVKVDIRSLELFAGGFHITVGQVDPGAQALQTSQVKIDGTRADGTSSGERNPCFLQACHQRPQYENGSPHLAHQIIRGFMIIQPPGIGLHGVALQFTTHAQMGQKIQRAANIPQIGHVGELVGAVAQQ